MDLRAEEISQILKDQIANYEARVDVAETGTILSVGDGICRIHGLANAVAGELLELPGGVAGMVAATIVYPLEVVKTMLTLYPEECTSIPGALKKVFRTGGVGALYRGLGPTLVAMVSAFGKCHVMTCVGFWLDSLGGKV